MYLSALSIASNYKNNDILHKILQNLVLVPNGNKDLLGKELRDCTKPMQATLDSWA